ncbi:MAG: NrsF family protein [Vicinamibacterales bacterium]
MDTDALIRHLSSTVTPVAPLGSPRARTWRWLAGSAAYLAVLAAVMSLRGDLATRVQEPRFLLEQVAALLTGGLAAGVALATTIPGYSRRLPLLVLPPALVWIGAVVWGWLADIGGLGAASPPLEADWGCVATILAGSAFPAIALARMLRRGVPLSPHLTAALGALGAAGVGNVGICLFHPHTSNLVILVWHCGSVLALALLVGATGGWWLRWSEGFEVR